MGTTIKSLLPLLKLYPWVTPMIVTLGFLASLAEGLGISLFIPLLQSIESVDSLGVNNNYFLEFIDRLLVNVSSQGRLLIIGCAIFGTIILKSSLNFSSTIIFSWYNCRLNHHLRIGIFRQFLNVSYSFLDTQDLGKLINTLASETWRASDALSVLFGLIIDICTIFVFVSLLLLISWKLTLLVSAALLFISYIIMFVTLQSKKLGQKAVEANQILTKQMWEGLSGMKVIRHFGRENYEQARFNRASKAVRNTFFQMDVLSGIVNPLSEVLSGILLVSMLVITLRQNSTALPTLLTFIFILYRLQPKVRQLDGCRVALSSLSTSVDEVMYLLDCSDKPYIRSGNIPFKGLKKGIAFEAVSFAYKSGEKTALQDISICIPKGKTTALVGTSGAGKSTLINLLYRFYDPNEGKIKVDGCPLEQLNLSDWRSRLAIVSQDIYMFSTTIRENITYGRLNATEAEIIQAAKLAHAHEFIQQFPDRYDTIVGDRGVRLSGGQRQRIALARAIISRPEILILDEATNALDSIAENIIQEAIATLSKKCTVIAIAHRLSTIEGADQIIVLEAGRVIERGNLQQLLQHQGLFAKLYALQNRNTYVGKEL
ncbi:MAG TPA: ABC transporter ATP-binding protein [Coleofasciculaceae cyanobacterium]|jgi:subfamily B ATP-binding cassette protein MsbA